MSLQEKCQESHPDRSHFIPVSYTHLYEGEYAVTISFMLKEDKPWAKAGHEVAFGQAVVKKIVKPVKYMAQEKPYTLIRGVYNTCVRGAEFEVLFSSLNGGLVSYRYAGKELIEEIPKPNFWRAPVDNDYGNDMPQHYAPVSYTHLTFDVLELLICYLKVSFNTSLPNFIYTPIYFNPDLGKRVVAVTPYSFGSFSVI